jgi:hypothetical protein
VTYNWVTVESSMVQALCWTERSKIERNGRRRPEPVGDLFVAFNTGKVALYP